MSIEEVVKDINQVEDFKTDPGDVADYSEMDDSPIKMDDKFKSIFMQLMNTGVLIDFNSNNSMDIAITGLYQTKIPNKYDNFIYYIQDKENNFYKLALLDFNDDDSFVVCKLNKEVDIKSLRKVIPPR